MKYKKVYIRVPLPNKEKLLSLCKSIAQQTNRTTQEQLKFYIKCVLEEIEKQMLEIKKSKKRIERYRQCIKIAEDIIAELNKV